MASIHKSIAINRSVEQVWDALRDLGALHTRLVVGFVTDTKLQGNVRDVTFANGQKARELILGVDDQRKRVAWSSASPPLTQYYASAQIFPASADACEVHWNADLLPDEMAAPITTMIEQGLAAMKRTLEAS